MLTVQRLHFLLIVSLLFIFWLFLFLPLQSLAVESTNEPKLELLATSAIAVDAETGKIFFEKNSKTPVPIASMTKVITAYLILEAEANGQINWADKITIDDRLYQLSHNLELSNVPFVKGASYSVKDLFNASMILSANAAVTALAEHIAGSEKEFVDLMRKKVRIWGLTDGYLISPSGLNNEDVPEQIYPGSKEKEENLLSARDMAVATQKLIHDFPEILDITSQPSILFPLTSDENIEMISTNLMLPNFPFYKEGVDGLKTGTTTLAGRSFIGTIKENELRLITVVTGLPIEGDDLRFEETAKIMNYVYNNWELMTLIKKGEPFPSYTDYPVKKGKSTTVPVVLTEDVSFWVEKEMDSGNLSGTLSKQKFSDDGGLTAPVKTKTEVASLEVTFPEDSLGYLTSHQQIVTVPLMTTTDVEKANLFTLIVRKFKSFFTSYAN